jgi:hypothetical protein
VVLAAPAAVSMAVLIYEDKRQIKWKQRQYAVNIDDIIHPVFKRLRHHSHHRKRQESRLSTAGHAVKHPSLCDIRYASGFKIRIAARVLEAAFR